MYVEGDYNFECYRSIYSHDGKSGSSYLGGELNIASEGEALSWAYTIKRTSVNNRPIKESEEGFVVKIMTDGVGVRQKGVEVTEPSFIEFLVTQSRGQKLNSFLGNLVSSEVFFTLPPSEEIFSGMKIPWMSKEKFIGWLGDALPEFIYVDGYRDIPIIVEGWSKHGGSEGVLLSINGEYEIIGSGSYRKVCFSNKQRILIDVINGIPIINESLTTLSKPTQQNEVLFQQKIVVQLQEK